MRAAVFKEGELLLLICEMHITMYVFGESFHTRKMCPGVSYSDLVKRLQEDLHTSNTCKRQIIHVSVSQAAQEALHTPNATRNEY